MVRVSTRSGGDIFTAACSCVCHVEATHVLLCMQLRLYTRISDFNRIKDCDGEFITSCVSFLLCRSKKESFLLVYDKSVS